ncbi:hypothetical protein CVT26_011475 [Gymnopilus dilepis]|uniref:Uncharacterized protein n=1 Tax=Gymnopilus dilepis TaxID=231916 RepID=A0A409W8Q6_9AGAR|nr:hypothetical protein CVT26_011475 [Gymnopilus dilepis]
MPLCHCQHAKCNGADISVAAFKKHKREDKISMLHAAAALTDDIDKRRHAAINLHLASANPSEIPRSDDNTQSKPWSPRAETYQHMVNSRLYQLSVIEKKIDALITSTERKLSGLGLPRSADEPFPLSPSKTSIREIFHELSCISHRSPAVQEAKTTISDRLSPLAHQLRDARNQWKKAQKNLPATSPTSKPSAVDSSYDTGELQDVMQ